MKVNMLEAKSQLSKLVKAAIEGEEVIIARDGVPMVKLVRVSDSVRRPGAWRELPPAASDWDAPAFNRKIADELAGD
jgi:prevent-host-death family protein